MKTKLLSFAAILTLLPGLASAQSSSLINTSTRGFAGAGASAMISGFVVNAPAGQLRWVLIRGVGPSLAGFGVASPLADPALRVVAGNGTVIATNDNVATAPNLALLNTVTPAVGAFPLTSAAEAAILVGVPAGTYTVQLSGGAAADPRAALLEVYEAGTVAAGQSSQTISGLAAANPNLTTLNTLIANPAQLAQVLLFHVASG
jgi:hypothetical protein